MGLDMWVEKLKKISNSEIVDGRYRNTLENIFENLLYIPKTAYEEDELMYKDILPVLQEEMIVCPVTRLDLLMKEHNIPSTAQLWHIHSSYDGTEFSYQNCETKEEFPPVFLPDSKREQYTEYKTLPYYLVQKQEVKYWRKEYSLQDRLYNLYYDNYFLRKAILDYCSKLKLDSAAVKSLLTNNAEIDKIILETGIPFSKVMVKELCKQLASADDINVFSQMPHSIQNCGYHAMNREMAKACGLLDEYKALRKDEMLIYHEWY